MAGLALRAAADFYEATPSGVELWRHCHGSDVVAVSFFVFLNANNKHHDLVGKHFPANFAPVMENSRIGRLPHPRSLAL